MGKIAGGISLNGTDKRKFKYKLQNSAAESQQLLLSAELYGQYVSLALRSEAVDTGNMTEITLVRQNIDMCILHH